MREKYEFYLFLVMTAIICYLLIIIIGGAGRYVQIELYKERIEDSVESEVVENIYMNTTEKCMDSNYFLDCFYNETKDYLDNITFVNDTEKEDYFLLNKTPEYTIENGGDCQNQFILWASIMKRGGKTVYLVRQNNHVCGIVSLGNEYKFFRCFPDKEMKFLFKV